MRSPRENRRQKAEGKRRKAEGKRQKAEGGSQNLGTFTEEAYARSVAEHGDLDVTFDYFTARVNLSITRHHRGSRDQHALVKFLAKLHLEDLYLATACARNSNPAWERFVRLYTKHISNVAHTVCSTHQEARDVESEIISHLFLPNGHGRSRIASYEGLSSLKSWLAPIIKNHASHRRELKWGQGVSLESLRQTPSGESAPDLEAALLNARYGEALADSFRSAAKQLTDRERLVLLLLYEAELPRGEVARMIGVHQSQITRTEIKAEQKFSRTVSDHLKNKHRLVPEAFTECVAAVFRTPRAVTIALLETIRPSAEPKALESAAA